MLEHGIQILRSPVAPLSRLVAPSFVLTPASPFTALGLGSADLLTLQDGQNGALPNAPIPPGANGGPAAAAPNPAPLPAPGAVAPAESRNDKIVRYAVKGAKIGALSGACILGIGLPVLTAVVIGSISGHIFGGDASLAYASLAVKGLIGGALAGGAVGGFVGAAIGALKG